jgi:hypothetical protein
MVVSSKVELQPTDIMTDYADGTDSIGLGGGFTYAALVVGQGLGAR